MCEPSDWLRTGPGQCWVPTASGRKGPWDSDPFLHPQMMTKSWGGMRAAGWSWPAPVVTERVGGAWKLLVLGAV